jgi:hypothetical protein
MSLHRKTIHPFLSFGVRPIVAQEWEDEVPWMEDIECEDCQGDHPSIKDVW